VTLALAPWGDWGPWAWVSLSLFLAAVTVFAVAGVMQHRSRRLESDPSESFRSVAPSDTRLPFTALIRPVLAARSRGQAPIPPRRAPVSRHASPWILLAVAEFNARAIGRGTVVRGDDGDVWVSVAWCRTCRSRGPGTWACEDERIALESAIHWYAPRAQVIEFACGEQARSVCGFAIRLESLPSNLSSSPLVAA
jgi:hypothetical protein